MESLDFFQHKKIQTVTVGRRFPEYSDYKITKKSRIFIVPLFRTQLYLHSENGKTCTIPAVRRKHA